MLWNPLACLSECLALLLVDFVHAFLSHSSGFSVGHAEHVISLHSSVDSAVAWDGLTEFGHLLGLNRWVNAVESVGSLFA